MSDKIYSVVNQKGGVGKTTTAVNLGAALAELGKRVLIIDLDPQGNATTGVSVNYHEAEGSVYDVIMTGSPMEDAIEPTSVKNLFIVPANIDLAGSEIELVPAFNRERRLQKAITELVEPYDYIFIDCPPSLGLLTINALTVSVGIIVPIQCEYYALEGLSQLTKNIALVRQNLNPDLEITGILLTMFDARTNLAAQVEADVRKHFDDVVFKTVIPRTVRVSEAPSFGEPVVTYDPSSKGAKAYINLGKELIERGQ